MTRTHLLASAAALALLPFHAAAQDAFLLDEIVISPNATPVERERAGSSVIVVTEEELRAAGNVQLSEFLARLPGISVVQNGPAGTFADLRIRGVGSRYIQVYVDGILVTDPSTPSGQFEDFGGLTTTGIRRVEILKGAQSPLYGGSAVGGVLSITTLGGPELGEGTFQEAGATVGSFGTIAGDYAFTRNTGPLSLSFALSHAQADGFSAADEENGNVEADGFDRSRLSFGGQYAVSDALTLGLNGFAETGSTEFDEFQSAPPFLPEDGTPGDETSDRDTRGLRAFATYSTGIWTTEAAVSGYTTDRTSSSNGFESTFSSERIAFDLLSTAAVRPDLALSFGLAYLDETAKSSSIPGGRETVTTSGVFVEAFWSPSDRLDLTGTIRYDDQSEFGGFTTGRLAFAWRPAEGTVIRGAAGSGYRPPSIAELFDDFGFFVGNPDLDPETSTSVELGIDQVWANGASLSATVFQSRIDDLITYTPGTGGAPDTLTNIPGESTIRGIEFGGSAPLNGWVSGYASATFLDAEDAAGNPLPRTPERDVVLGLEASFTDRLDADLWVQAVGGIPEVDDYQTLNLGLSYALTDGIDAFAQGLNLLDEQYQTTAGYGTADRSVFFGINASF